MKDIPEKQSLSDPLDIKNIWSFYQACGIWDIINYLFHNSQIKVFCT